MIIYSSWMISIVFLLCAVLIWTLGIRLAKAVDIVINHFKWGEAIGGMLFLAIIADLPEIAITAIAAYKHQYTIAVSNLFGGIAIQTVVLVVIDIFGVGRKAPLTHKGHSSILKIEGIAVIIILLILLLGYVYNSSNKHHGKYTFESIIFILWVLSIYWTKKIYDKHQIKKQKKLNALSLKSDLIISAIAKPIKLNKNQKINSAILLIIVGSIIILFAGMGLEISGEILSKRWGLSGVLFGSTILALCTALPEISTGIASAKIRDYEMAVSDIFGGNSFLAILLLMAAIISGESLLPYFTLSDIYLICVGILLTLIYLIGMHYHSKRQYCRMGVDSLVVLIVYIISIIVLLFLK